MIWKFITFFVKKLEPEIAHQIFLIALKLGLHPRLERIEIPVKINNLHFINFLGVAAGFDKNAQVIEKIHHLNFGLTEVGTITPLPQYGNPKPRVFRLEKDQAIINRNGFNNLGMAQAIIKLKHYRKKFPVGSDFVLGINIGPNKDSNNRFKDYEILSKDLSEFADYLTINISSPNTPNLRDFHETQNLEKVLISVKNGIAESKKLELHLPIFLKISPDITENNLNLIIETANKNNIAGLIISNTTVDRYKDLHPHNLHEGGGLSGKPLFTKSTTFLALANKIIKHKKYNLYLIASGGVLDAKSAYAKILCGAHLVQLYSSMTFVGPLIADNILKGLQQLMNRDKISSINDVRGIVDNPEAAMKIANDGIIDNFQT